MSLLRWPLSFTLLSFIFSSKINAQFQAYPYFAPNAVAESQLPSNCSAAYMSVNASGTYSLGASFVNGNWNGGTAEEDLSWTVTVGQNTSTGEFTSSNWLGTPPGNIFWGKSKCTY